MKKKIMYIHYTHKNMASRILKKINRPDGKEFLKTSIFNCTKKHHTTKVQKKKKKKIVQIKKIKILMNKPHNNAYNL